MFFVLSKVLGFFALPSNFVISVALLGALLLATRFRRLGWWLVIGGLAMLTVIGLSPLGNALILPLEQRFPQWDHARGAPDGIVVLGGAISPDVSAGRGVATLNEAAERMTVAVELARRYPNMKIAFTGGTGALLFREGNEAEIALSLFESLGVARNRVILESKSRNTVENAVFTRDLVQPKPTERWLLVTSAYHMPRAIGIFRHANFPVEAYPVDFRTRGADDYARPFFSVGDGMRRTDTATREWVGLVVYWLTGQSSELLPGPEPRR